MSGRTPVNVVPAENPVREQKAVKASELNPQMRPNITFTTKQGINIVRQRLLNMVETEATDLIDGKEMRAVLVQVQGDASSSHQARTFLLDGDQEVLVS